MFNIGIVFWRIRHDVVNIVVVFPPTKRQTAYEICKKHADEGIDVVVVSNSHVPRIMNDKDKLIPETAETHGAEQEPLPAKEYNHKK